MTPLDPNQVKERSEALLQSAKTVLGSWAAAIAAPAPNRIDVTLTPDDLERAVSTLVTARWGYLAAITGLDIGVTSGMLEVLYHFCSDAVIVTLRVQIPRENPAVPSICDKIPYADLYERELMEMFGITVTNTPSPTRLFVAEDWPEGVFPLRKDAPVQEPTIRA
ncbi:MAG TPA: NADH-quinone oxidoreductase subunit C [Aggregatilineaceae bacterium]|nr:NADH-quinone oxidoreductase subunit C [Aggregatilineaceae bacterium]